MNKRENYNEYMNEYMKKRYKQRRLAVIKDLGGCCVICGATKGLELDHIDPQTKYKTIAQLSSASDEIFQREVSKCQLLCVSCHTQKSRLDGSYLKLERSVYCACGRFFGSVRAYAGHRRWCKIHREYNSIG